MLETHPKTWQEKYEELLETTQKKQLPRLYSDITEDDQGALDGDSLAQQEFEYTLGIHEHEIDKLQKEVRELNNKIFQYYSDTRDEKFGIFFDLINKIEYEDEVKKIYPKAKVLDNETTSHFPTVYWISDNSFDISEDCKNEWDAWKSAFSKLKPKK